MSTELPVATRHRRDMTGELLKATLNPNTHTHTHGYTQLMIQESSKRTLRPWLMCFHPDICYVLSATQKQKPVQFIYKFHGYSLEKIDSTKYLGVTFQSNLKWDNYINNITSKANQTLGFLRRNLKVNSQKIK